MTTKTKSDTAPAKAEIPAPAVKEPAAPPADPGQCVVSDGKPHVGRAVMGRVCSYHAMHYRPDGTPRS